MKASEARRLTKNSITINSNRHLQIIYSLIKEAANKGRNCVAVISPPSPEAIIHQLEYDGYKVKRNHGYYRRDNQSWDNLDISWE